jgi:hypothetical protein
MTKQEQSFRVEADRFVVVDAVDYDGNDEYYVHDNNTNQNLLRAYATYGMAADVCKKLNACGAF